MNYVVGSGPAGVSAAAALLDRGESVTMLDAGGDLEPEIQALVGRLSQQDYRNWNPAEVEALKGPLRYNSEGAPLKLIFGSDYPYRNVDGLQPVEKNRVDSYRALATGGLSVLWGASILPFTNKELSGWPFSADDLNPHYASVLRTTGLAGDHDELEERFPLLIEPSARLELSSQAESILHRMRANAADLRRQHLHFGKSRVAINSASATVPECVRCGLCLYGCPYGLIYSSRNTVGELVRSSSFRYVSGFIVRRLRETDGVVQIEATSVDGKELKVFEADRVYLAAGVHGSTTIMLASMGEYDRGLTLKQSDHFLLPILLRGPVGRMSDERLHTLSQLFIELEDPSISRHGIHLQIYTYNDFFSRMARDKLGVGYPVVAPILERLFDRLVLIKGYLHSEDSSSIRATLMRPDSPKYPSRLKLDTQFNPRARKTVRKVARLLSRNSSKLGFYPVRPGLRLGLPGSGVHVGGSFPMALNPGHFETDLFGRPNSFERVHIVDSSVFPTIPAPTITLTAMANAHRIASHKESS